MVRWWIGILSKFRGKQGEGVFSEQEAAASGCFSKKPAVDEAREFSKPLVFSSFSIKIEILIEKYISTVF